MIISFAINYFLAEVLILIKSLITVTGSGKKALLDIIACRANNGSKKGYVLLNGVNMNRRLFRVSFLLD